MNNFLSVPVVFSGYFRIPVTKNIVTFLTVGDTVVLEGGLECVNGVWIDEATVIAIKAKSFTISANGKKYTVDSKGRVKGKTSNVIWKIANRASDNGLAPQRNKNLCFG